MVINRTLRSQLLAFAMGFIFGQFKDLEALTLALESLALEARKQLDVSP